MLGAYETLICVEKTFYRSISEEKSVAYLMPVEWVTWGDTNTTDIKIAVKNIVIIHRISNLCAYQSDFVAFCSRNQ